ncbi:MAG: isopentenyl transferase family protein [Dehalococcoidia bacterium]|nr:isopentenyl transferase family protein [Dehalococcoidia bacterium]
MPWKILLIGGSTGTGKTRLAQELGRELRVSVLQVDDLRLGLQAITTETSHPALHSFTGASAEKTLNNPESIVEGYLSVAEIMEPAVRAVMSHHIDVADTGPLIIEGDGILPRLGSVEYLRQVDSWFQNVADDTVRSLFLVEEDLQQLRANMYGRARGDGNAPGDREGDRSILSQGGWRLGQKFKIDAGTYSVPVILSRPFDGLLQRALDALGLRGQSRHRA